MVFETSAALEGLATHHLLKRAALKEAKEDNAINAFVPCLKRGKTLLTIKTCLIHAINRWSMKSELRDSESCRSGLLQV